ncbi:MAG: aminotransferase class III-fold pyridoxal phosphate-dependent enzyme, partial [Actinomycetota bacterium]
VARERGERLKAGLATELGEDGIVGDVRGRGMLVAVELVRDRATKDPFERIDRVTERVMAAAKERGLLMYPSAGNADGERGDIVMFGPAFELSDDVIEQMISRCAEAIRTIG